MNLSKYSLLLGLIIVMFFVSLIGAHFGFTVNGVPLGGLALNHSSGILGMLDMLWAALEFLFCMATFTIDGVPAILCGVFTIMTIMTGYMLLELLISLVGGAGTPA